MRSNGLTSIDEVKKVLSTDNNRAGITLYYDESTGKKYKDTSESNVCILGVPGSGKTSTATLLTAYDVISNNESLIAIDPKRDMYKKTIERAKETHDVYVINLRYPEKSDSYNFLIIPFRKYRTGKPKEMREAVEIINDFSSILYPITAREDPYWKESSRNLFVGACLALFEMCNNEKEINILSVFNLINFLNGLKSPADKDTLLSSLSSRVNRELSGFLNSPNETKLSTFAVTCAGLKHLVSNDAIIALLSGNDLNLDILKGDKPVAVYIIMPDETDIYGTVAAILIQQIITHYISVAETEYDGKLPIRTHVMIEELCNIGPIPKLPLYLAAARSRNIRLYCILQSFSQLKGVYGDSADAIKDCFDILVAYRVSSMGTLDELSRRLGEKRSQRNDVIFTEPLISPSQLGAFVTRQALVLIRGRYKYTTILPFFSDIVDVKCDYQHHEEELADLDSIVSSFDIQQYFSILKKEHIDKILGITHNPVEKSFEERFVERFEDKPPTVDDEDNEGNDNCDDDNTEISSHLIETLVSHIDEKIAELEIEEVFEYAKLTNFGDCLNDSCIVGFNTKKYEDNSKIVEMLTNKYWIKDTFHEQGIVLIKANSLTKAERLIYLMFKYANIVGKILHDNDD